MEKKKRKVYFFESQIPMSGVIYLPLVSGILQGYAQSFPELNEQYEFMPFIFMRNTPEEMVKDVKDPFLMAFSVCIWNHQISLACAKLVKERYPECVIVFGGPQVLHDDRERYPFIDKIIEEEGEKKFVALLANLSGVNIDYTTHNLENYPSPYTLGLYDEIIKENTGIDFQAIVETNRGCPFTCSFCYWGQGFEEKKVRHHSLQHVKEEAEWIAKNRIKYVFMADANFGMYERDYEIAKIYCEIKEKYGYPDKVRVCYGKNKEENVFKVARLLHENNLAKAITLARQSNDPVALANIRRSNIKLSVYDNLRERYYNEGIATYTEIILGMPGETKESFKKGVEEIAGTPTQLFIYHCTILPNTEMYKPEYIAKHGIKTVRVPLTEIHGEIRKAEYVTEYENIVVATSTMPLDDWMECAVFSWCTQLRCVFGVDEIPTSEIDRFWEIARGITEGKSRGQVDLRFGEIYWEPEEIAYLRIAFDNGEISRWVIENNKGSEGWRDFARENVLWGRKSKVQKKKEMV